MGFENILVAMTASEDHPLTTVTINRPDKLNALNQQTLRELTEAVTEFANSPTQRVMLLTGAGEKAFCSGADLSGDLSATPQESAMIGRGLLKTSTFSKPIVAAVNGDCVAGGLELLLASDIRAAAPHARFGLPEVRWSIYPFGGATVKLIEQSGYVHAMDLLLTAEPISADSAAALGLINRVVPAAELMGWAIAKAEVIAANSPSAVQAVKRQISATIADHAGSREALDQELGDAVRAGPHFDEGVAAFLEKRNPNYE